MEKMRLILLAGQSNMAGRGVPQAEDLQEIPGVYSFSENGQWVPAVEPISFDRPGSCGVSGGRTFARKLMEYDPSSPIGLIPTAVGGTAISAWKPGGKDHASDKHPYDDMLQMARAAMKDGEIIAVLWHQGETDFGWKTASYEADLTEVVKNFRRDLGLETVPFICGELGEFLLEDNDPFLPVTEGIANVVKNLPYMGLASAGGLKDKGDRLHFDTPDQHIFGERYFAEYLRIIKG